MKEHTYFVYMIASASRVLYIGMSNNLRHRVWEHKNDLLRWLPREYKCHRLVWYESYDDVAKTIDREKQLKRWNRSKKDWLIPRKTRRGKTCRRGGTNIISLSQRSR